MTTPRACILAPSGPKLTARECRFFAQADPWGFILFARNVETPGQLAQLTDALRNAVGRDAPILIDQEGGRVARMGPPHWRAWPPVREVCDAAEDEQALLESLALRYRIIGEELRDVGIDVNCVPLLDVPQPGIHWVIGNRTLGSDPLTVARRAKAVVAGCLAGGVLPVIKHIPGHGRTALDTHHALAVVETTRDALRGSDFQPFRDLADMRLGMTAHIVYRDIDPLAPATFSADVITEIRQVIGFSGCLMTDDISMGALAGSIDQRCIRAILAGCDLILHCNGAMDEMEKVAGTVPRLSGPALDRAALALAARPTRPVQPDRTDRPRAPKAAHA
ncbi:MAG: glycoside hydrolase family 3 N-terminal domain-containing protein [Pseudomonadota bacterium]